MPKYSLQKQRLFTVIISSLFFLSVSFILMACGNKGDLYLPNEGSKNDTDANLETNSQKKKN